MTIYRFQLDPVDSQLIRMPEGSVVLSAQLQHDIITVWAMVNPHANMIARRFNIYGTGHPIDANINQHFIGTVQAGSLVWHVFAEV